jgi:predicted amidohydrolase
MTNKLNMSANQAFKIGSVQMVSTLDPMNNLHRACELIKKAAGQGCQMVVLPEYFCFFGHSDKDKFKIQEKIGGGPLQDGLASVAQKEKIYVVAGTLPISSDQSDRLWNTSLVFSPTGSVHARYDKIHLFAFQQGDESYDEAKTLLAGNQSCTFDVQTLEESWKFGLSICYDIRFPELYREMGEVDAHILPAAFTHTTGGAHWEILLRARAIENQSYFIAAAQGGLHENGRRTWGQSLICDPWGKLINTLTEGEGVVIGELSKELIKEVRSKLPALKHRRK